MFRQFTAVVAAACVVMLLSSRPTTAQGEKKEREAVILSPKKEAKVEQFADIEGQVKGGWPVVLVQPLVSGQPWYIQGQVEELANGNFTAKAQFGEDKLPKDTKFRVVIILAKDKAAAHKYEPGATRNSLPAGLPRSEYVDVVRVK